MDLTAYRQRDPTEPVLSVDWEDMSSLSKECLFALLAQPTTRVAAALRFSQRRSAMTDQTDSITANGQAAITAYAAAAPQDAEKPRT